jgi:type I restriction enzyme S subunit
MRKDWEIKRLSEIGKIFNGNSINEEVKKVNYTNLDDGFPFIATKDIGFDGIVNYENGVKIPFSEKNNFKTVPPNTPLICAEGGSAGKKVGFINQEVCFGNKLFALIPYKNIDSKFIYYYYFNNSFQKHFNSGMAGLIGGVSMNKFKEINIPLPPLFEQLEIVSILDDAFESMQRAKSNAEQNLKNAKELFESYLQNIFENPKENWEKKKWGDLCHFVRGPFGGSLKKSIFKEDGYVVYEQKHAIHDHFNQLRYFIDEDKFNEMIRFELKPGDIIMSCSGVTLGRVAIVPDGIKRGIINQALLKLTPKKNVSVNFIKHWLRSPIFQKIIFDFAGGAAIPNVPSAKILKDILIPFPSLKEQEKVVNDIELVLVETEKLESIYQQKLNDLDELKKSILQKAFNGELKTSKISA